ncbi:ABC transporter permease [Georgenia wutianyii]|nr:ABC transporter permease [Georgenia wutianyii]
MRQLLTMTGNDLRQRLRDKSVLIFGIVVPVALMLVLNLVFGDTGDVELGPVTVAASAPADDASAQVLLETLTRIEGLDVTVEEVPADEVRPMAESGQAQLGLLLPEGFGEDVDQGRGARVEIIEGDGAGMETDVLVAVVRGVGEQLTAGTVATRAAAAAGVPPEDLATIAREVGEAPASVMTVEGTTATEQLGASASLVAGQAGLFLLFTVGFGVLAIINERDQGTFARLRSMPIPPGLIVAAKALAGYVLGVVATLVLLTAGVLLFDVEFGSPLLVLVLVLCVVAAATSLTFVVVRVARTSEQAGVAQSIIAVVLGLAGGAFFPVTATGPLSVALDLNPVSAFTRGLGISAGGGGLSEIAGPVLAMLGFALVAAVASRLLPDRGVAA